MVCLICANLWLPLALVIQLLLLLEVESALVFEGTRQGMDLFGTEVVQKEKVSFEFKVRIFSVFLPVLPTHVHILFSLLASLLLFLLCLLFLFDIFSNCLVHKGCCFVALTCLHFV